MYRGKEKIEVRRMFKVRTSRQCRHISHTYNRQKLEGEERKRDRKEGEKL